MYDSVLHKASLPYCDFSHFILCFFMERSADGSCEPEVGLKVLYSVGAVLCCEVMSCDLFLVT